mmetsp:Transcript_10547/g.21935  ORF Transcript_10547/g.21935 Transcript_10547/m.21935 type:complete len:857 (+) Transcript_10547:326-2896(+)
MQFPCNINHSNNHDRGIITIAFSRKRHLFEFIKIHLILFISLTEAHTHHRMMSTKTISASAMFFSNGNSDTLFMSVQSSFAFGRSMHGRPSSIARRGLIVQTRKKSRQGCGFNLSEYAKNTKFTAIQSMGTMRMSSASPASYSRVDNSSSGKGFGKNDKRRNSKPKDEWKVIDVPLVFVPGMKGTHLAFDDIHTQNHGSSIPILPSGSKKKRKKKRAWLTLSHLLNFPPRPDDDPMRDLSLPLTYDHEPPPGTDPKLAEHYPRQHRGKLVPDGIVDHIIEVNLGDGENVNYLDLNFLPFYGHCTKAIREMDIAYHKIKHDGLLESTDTFQLQDESDNGSTSKYDGDATSNASDANSGVFDRIGSFVERTSFWDFSNEKTGIATEQESNQQHSSPKYCRPTAIFSYDWRRPLPELCTELHNFCEETFPNQPVQIVAHSLGGLMTFAAMRHHPKKYAPGAVVVGVPFETGIQYLQDLHKGYYTELDRCRQFTPGAQFTMSSHWGFFPISKKRLQDRFVDVTEHFENGGDHEIKFDSDKSGIGKIGTEFQPAVKGASAYFDFYNPDAWEELQLGVFGPEFDDKLCDKQREAYKEHMSIQMAAAKAWRKRVLGEDEEIDNNDGILNQIPIRFDPLARGDAFPPLVACATNTIPTVNQILRRKRQTPKSTSTISTRKGRNPWNDWEYDYINGRSVPGDGRIDFDKAFPPEFVPHKVVALDSAHAKQMCWEDSGGSWGTISNEVILQIECFIQSKDVISVLESDREVAVKEFERFTTNMTVPSQIDSDAMISPELQGTKKGRKRAIVKSLVSRAKRARDRLRQRYTTAFGSPSTSGNNAPGLDVATQQRRISARGRKSFFRR